MIRRVVDFALNNRFVVLCIALVLILWGALSFHQLPVEAYPDVADNYVEIISQWPGIAAEQIEQQVTIPLETVMNGIPHVTHLRSFSLFGLSDLKLIFDDEEENAWNRERVLERLSQVTFPQGVVPVMGTDWSPVGQIYFFTSKRTSKPSPTLSMSPVLADLLANTRCASIPTSLLPMGSASRKSNSNSPTATPTPAAASSKPVCSKSTFARLALSETSLTSKTRFCLPRRAPPYGSEILG